MRRFELEIYDGCPCGTYGKCCNGTSGCVTPEHECEDDEFICEACYVSECLDCGATCSCDL